MFVYASCFCSSNRVPALSRSYAVGCQVYPGPPGFPLGWRPRFVICFSVVIRLHSYSCSLYLVIASMLSTLANTNRLAAVTYNGDDTQRTITTGIQSDLIIVKQHNTTNNNWYVVDAVRGIADAAGTSLVLDQSGEGGNASAQVDAIGGATSWQSGASADYTNGGGRNYVNYTWKAKTWTSRRL